MLAFLLSLAHRAHRPEAGPSLRERGGWRSRREESLGSFFTEEVCGRHMVTHSSTKRRKAGVKLILGVSSQVIPVPGGIQGNLPPTVQLKPPEILVALPLSLVVSRSLYQQVIQKLRKHWFGGLVASTLTRTGVMHSGLRSALL